MCCIFRIYLVTESNQEKGSITGSRFRLQLQSTLCTSVVFSQKRFSLRLKEARTPLWCTGPSCCREIEKVGADRTICQELRQPQCKSSTRIVFFPETENPNQSSILLDSCVILTQRSCSSLFFQFLSDDPGKKSNVRLESLLSTARLKASLMHHTDPPWRLQEERRKALTCCWSHCRDDCVPEKIGNQWSSSS